MKSKFLFALAATIFATTICGLGLGLLIVAPFLLAMNAYKVAKRWSLKAFSWLSLNRVMLQTRAAVILCTVGFPIVVVIHLGHAVYRVFRESLPVEVRSLVHYWRTAGQRYAFGL